MTSPRTAFLFAFAAIAALGVLSPGAARAQEPSAANPPPQGPSTNKPVAPSSAQTKPKFDIFEYQVEGNTTLDTRSIERAVYPFLGKDKSIDDVEAARAALEKAYRDKGYGTVGVDIPEQAVAAHVVVLRVVEGHVESIHVIGAKYYSQGRILNTVESLAPGKVPYFPKVQQELAAVNDSPDRKVTPLLRPGQLPGTTDVDLEVEDKLPLHGSVQLNNDYTPLTTRTRVVNTLDYDNVFQREQRLSLLYETSPEDPAQVEVYSLGYSIPVDGQYLALSYVRSNSATAAGVGDTAIFGRGSIIGLHDVIPFPAKSEPGVSLSQTISLGFDYKNFEENVTIGPQAGFSTPVTYVPFTLGYAATRVARGGQWDWGSSLEFAIRDFRSAASQFDDKRFKALNNFAILRWNLARIQPLPDSYSLFARMDFQLSDQPLISNEQLVVGGADSVRGYLAANETGDSGVHESFELRSPNLARGTWPWMTDVRAHVFVDGAYVRILSPLPEQTASFSLLSTGMGLSTKVGSHFSLDLDLGWPLRTVQFTHAGSPRLQASSTVSF